MNVLFLAVLLLFALPGWAESDLLVDKLKAKGFVCSAAEGGDVCKVSSVKAPGFRYSQPIVIFVPKNVRRPSNTLIHLHGHRCVCEPCNTSPEKMFSQFDFARQMKEVSAANSVLVAPMSTGKCTNFESELAPQFDKFMQWVNSSVDPTQEGFLISGHSGAGRAIGTIVGEAAGKNPKLLKKMEGVVLLDATYSTRPAYFEQWNKATKVHPDLRVYSVFNVGVGTEVGSKMLKSSMPHNEVEIERSAKTSHCKVPNEYFAKGLKFVQRGSYSNGPKVFQRAGAR